MSSALTTLVAGPFPTDFNMTMAGKVVGVHATATTYVLVPYNDDGDLLSDNPTTVTVGPWATTTTTGAYDAYWTQTYGLTEGSDEATLSLHCQMSGRAPLACTQQKQEGSKTMKETYTGSVLKEDIPAFNEATVYITGGQKLLSPSTSAADGAGTTLGSTAKAQSTATESSGSQETGSTDSPSGASASSRSILATAGLAAVAMVALWL
ncbi:hypothetical protein FHETE_2444 [Fusarium heterosporum]|uniref:Uncharacterized protein n=1 Tax=Fusarium heterosporum TaxID=42747 RepID=A0A8H5WXM0_FUSHE|nr:hypothetical protein FHETE_2444 [Fusarium heterosporum]